MADWDFLQLPVGQLCGRATLVLVWVTNKQRQQNFVREHLFPKWNIKYLTKWYWLKVTWWLLLSSVLIITNFWLRLSWKLVWQTGTKWVRVSYLVIYIPCCVGYKAECSLRTGNLRIIVLVLSWCPNNLASPIGALIWSCAQLLCKWPSHVNSHFSQLLWRYNWISSEAYKYAPIYIFISIDNPRHSNLSWVIAMGNFNAWFSLHKRASIFKQLWRFY